MKLNYRNQLLLALAIILLFNILSTVLRHWIYRSIGFVLCGMLYIIHPVLPKNALTNKKTLLAVRLAGIILILIGIFTRSYAY
ncbi:MAG: hypothetical protein E7457_06075 [Ruminococcaceae bacterium]|nr:hypothetical protein [Oscillospiraceae bacterium]